jgi:MYXO-CTERM domain-containing protein
VTPTEPPGVGTVSDGLGTDIDSQTSTSTIEANWTGFTASLGDPISFYEWAIGTASGLTNVQGWVNVGTATNATNSTLSMSPGMRFVSVRATSVSGLTSTVATSDGVQVLPPPAPARGDDDDRGRCSFSADAGSGSAIGLLGALLLGLSVVARRK